MKEQIKKRPTYRCVLVLQQESKQSSYQLISQTEPEYNDDHTLLTREDRLDNWREDLNI